MSAIHDALKRAREDQPVVVAVSKKNAAGWLWAVTVVLFAVQSSLYFRESHLRRKSENKMQQAYLQLNDERGKSLDLLKDRTDTEDRVAAITKERDRALADKKALVAANKQVEFDNIAKETKISQMTKDLHRLEMAKLELEKELSSLKSQPQPPQN